MAVGGYDGMHLIYEALKKTNGATDGDDADRGDEGHGLGEPARPDLDRRPRRATSSRTSTSARSRRSDGELYNVEFATIPNVKDPVKAAKNSSACCKCSGTAPSRRSWS